MVGVLQAASDAAIRSAMTRRTVRAFFMSDKQVNRTTNVFYFRIFTSGYSIWLEPSRNSRSGLCKPSSYDACNQRNACQNEKTHCDVNHQYSCVLRLSTRYPPNTNQNPQHETDDSSYRKR